MAQIDLGSIKFNWKGSYSGATAYVVDDVVESSGSSYICIAATTGNAPPNATYWEQMSQAGTDGTDLTTTLTAQGDIVYRDASGLARLGAGTSGQLLQTGGTGANPSWTDAPAGTNIVMNSDATGYALTTDQRMMITDMTLTKTNPTIHMLAVCGVGSRSAGNLDDENIKFDLQYSTDGGSTWVNGFNDAYNTDVFAPGQDDTHNNDYDTTTKNVSGSFTVTASSGTTIKVALLFDYSGVNNGQTIYINRTPTNASQGSQSTLIAYEE